MRLRAYRAEDREGCLRVLDSNMPDYFLASDREEVGSFLDRLAEMGVRYFVIEDEDDRGKIVACGGVAVDEKKDARMCWGMVHRARHRTGLGRVLLVARLLEGARMGARTASLATIPAVEGFFAKAGFALTGGEDDHYAPGMHRRDYAMTLDVELLAQRFTELAAEAHLTT